MTVKELQDKLSEYSPDLEVMVGPTSADMVTEIIDIDTVNSWDPDESPIVTLFYDL